MVTWVKSLYSASGEKTATWVASAWKLFWQSLSSTNWEDETDTNWEDL